VSLFLAVAKSKTDESMLTRVLRNYPVILYILLWAMVILVHFFVLLLVYQFPVSIAITESIVFNALFALLGMGIWYMVKFSDLTRKKTLEIILYHLGGASVTLVIWLSGANILLHELFSSDALYLEFLNRSLPVRLISGLLYYAFMVSLFYLIIYFRELQEKIERENQLNLMLKEAELKTLRAQIRPHFLFNSLNSISALTMTEPLKAQEMVIKLSEFMRFSLSEQDEKIIPLEKELYQIELYLDIEKVRFGNKLIFNKNIDPACLSMLLPALILQPLIENAVKYGVYEALGENRLIIRAEYREGLLDIFIENEFDPDYKTKKGTGTGLKNVAGRLKAIYNRNDLVSFRKSVDVFSVNIKIPQE
jgi:two-component system, LytTR family, sensor kinase